MLIHILIRCFFSYGTVMRPWMKSDCAPLEGGDWKPLLHFRANSAVGDSKSLMAEIFGWKAMSGSSFLGIAMEKKRWLQTHIYGGGEKDWPTWSIGWRIVFFDVCSKRICWSCIVSIGFPENFQETDEVWRQNPLPMFAFVSEWHDSF